MGFVFCFRDVSISQTIHIAKHLNGPYDKPLLGLLSTIHNAYYYY